MNDFIVKQTQRISRLSHAAESRARAFPAVNLLLQTAFAFSEDRCSLISGALGYYSLLSIFPLMLFSLAVASVFIPPDRVVRLVAGFFTANFPFSTTLLQNNLQQVTNLRGAVTLVSGTSFIWSASGVFDSIQLGINRAFRVQRPRPLWRQRIVSFGMVIAVSLIFLSSFLLTTLMRLFIHYHLLVRHTLFTDALPTAAAITLSIIVFGLLYRYIPFDPTIRWRNVWVGAVIAAALWEIAKLIFAWYITSYALLNLVYGSVGAIIAIMLWVYVTAAIMLFGAELAAVQMGARQRVKTGQEWWALVSP